MKITLYTITDCQYSKQEKEYLTSHTLQFEEKNLETNRDFLTEMLTLSNNFAGTPVTKIEKDDGQIVVLKGFTKDEFDKTLGFSAPVSTQSTPTHLQNPVQTPIETPEEPKISPPIPSPAPTIEQPTEPSQSIPQTPQVPETANPMSSVLDNLQEQASAAPPLPSIPDPKL